MRTGRERPRILVFVDYYDPGYLAGGPIRSVRAIVSALRDSYDFYILTRGHDLGSSAPYPDLARDEWITKPTDPGHDSSHPVSYWYCSRVSMPRLIRNVRAAIAVRPDLVYLNSIFSIPFGIAPLLAHKLGLFPGSAILVAPRGELQTGALSLHPWRKNAYLIISRLLRLLSGATWHATSAPEATELAHHFPRASIKIAPNFVPPTRDGNNSEESSRPKKTPGTARLVFLSRIARTKNLDLALRAVSVVRGSVEFDIFGPPEDSDYYRDCRAIAARDRNATIRFRGPVRPEAVPTILASYDALLLPSLSENFGHAIVEALSAGLPVLVSDRTPWRGLAERKAGWDLPLAVRPFAEKIQFLVDMTAAEYDQWRNGAHQLAMETARQHSDNITAIREAFQSALAANHQRRKR